MGGDKPKANASSVFGRRTPTVSRVNQRTGKERFSFLLYEINAQNVFLIKIWNSLLDKILLKEVGLSK